MPLRALITGVTGQDGAYLADHLLDLGYEVWGARRRGSSSGTWRLEALGVAHRIRFVEMELTDPESMRRAVLEARPDEAYNLAAQSFVGSSFRSPHYCADVTGVGAVKLMSVVAEAAPDARFYQASTSEMFGGWFPGPHHDEYPKRYLDEGSPMRPRSPYAAAKLYAHAMVGVHRAQGREYVSGILFNHESPLRGVEFVTRRITHALARYVASREGGANYQTTTLGNLSAKRDWGFAGDYVKAMRLMVKESARLGPTGALVIATGRTETVSRFIEIAAAAAGLSIGFRDNDDGATEVVDVTNDRVIFRTSDEQRRPAEVDVLLGCAEEAEIRIGWTPTVTLEEMVAEMVRHDLARVRAGWPTL